MGVPEFRKFSGRHTSIAPKAKCHAEDQGDGASSTATGSKSRKKDKRKKAKGYTMVYPAGNNATLRTHERHMELARRDGPLSDEADEFFGVHEGRIFLTEILPGFDIVRDICIDWMHQVCEGTEWGGRSRKMPCPGRQGELPGNLFLDLQPLTVLSMY